MRILYTHSGNLRAPKANLVHVARMSQAFAKIPTIVNLYYPRYILGNTLAQEDVRSFYSLANNVRIRPLTTFLIPWFDGTWLVPISKTIGYVFELPRLFVRDRVRSNDLVFATCFLASAFFSVIRRLLPRSLRPILLFEAHDPPRGIRARVLKEADGIVAITEALKQILVSDLRIEDDKILVASNGVPEAWTQNLINKRDARIKLGLDAELPYVMYTGNLNRDVYADTLELLIEIARALEGEAQLIQIGNPPPANNRSNELPHNLQFLGLQPLEAVRVFQAAADVLLIPYSSRLRTVKFMSPVKLLEYMAAGRPIVAFDHSVLREVLTDRENAVLIQPDDSFAMAEGIRSVLADSELSDWISNNAQQQAKAHTWEQRARAIVKFAIERQIAARSNPSVELRQ